ncbi:hypothetical protein M413DRAFT_27438 [Hebeloma cylindrosporum]|uniref:Uncharacterized protein n=1 Tax=Hebeloma cylindrosporum TaxID=76867 RepID=A0A0C2YLH5_HEBCY|nr:hypothetical protein M413DRAFT_27438 [Hebeloma cylindrosporum h7]
MIYNDSLSGKVCASQAITGRQDLKFTAFGASSSIVPQIIAPSFLHGNCLHSPSSGLDRRFDVTSNLIVPRLGHQFHMLTKGHRY